MAGSLKNHLLLLAGRNLTPYNGDVTFNQPEGLKTPFLPHYNQFILPHLAEYENKRINALKSYRKRIPLGVLAFIAVTIASVLLIKYLKDHHIQQPKDFNGWIIGGAAMLCAGIYYTVTAPIKGYLADIKREIFPHIFSYFGEEYSYDPAGRNIFSGFWKKSDIVPDYDKVVTEDYVSGKHSDVAIELSEVNIQKKVKTKNGYRYQTMFKGLAVLLSMNKNFSGKTVVKKDAGIIGNWVRDKFNDTERVKLEDPIFEKKFEVFSSDQIEARYILTTSFMERLLKLSDIFGDGKIQCSFFDEKLFIMINSKKDRFESGSVFVPVTFQEAINNILGGMNEIFSIIETLKLNQRIGL